MMSRVLYWGVRAVGACALLWLLGACQSVPSVAVPARMVTEKTTAQCLEQMQNAAQRLGGPRVVFTHAAFASEDRLSVVPSETVADASGQPASGRLSGLPDSFRLTLDHGICTMVREADARATPLGACTCVAIP